MPYRYRLPPFPRDHSGRRPGNCQGGWNEAGRISDFIMAEPKFNDRELERFWLRHNQILLWLWVNDKPKGVV